MIEFKCHLKARRERKTEGERWYLWKTIKSFQMCKILHLKYVIIVFFPQGLPSPPRTPSYTVQQYGRDSVTLTVQWQPPQYDGGNSVSYTITVSPGFSPVTTSGTSVPVTVSYNVVHTVSIVATNCNGSSSAVMLALPAIGMLL